MRPRERAQLDQSIEELARLLETFGVDRRDPVAMKGALVAIQAVNVLFVRDPVAMKGALAAIQAVNVLFVHAPPGADRDSMARGLLLAIAEMQP